MAKKLPPDVLEFFQKTGAKGGKKRAESHSKKQLSEWGKLGGRPKKKTTETNIESKKEKK